MKSHFLGLGVLVLFAGGFAAGQAEPALAPGEPFDYPSQAFYPERWEAKGLTMPLVPWKGEEVTVLTTDTELDGQVMAEFIARLDEGWRLYGELTGGTPRPFKQHEGQVTIVALPANDLSCGYGCGYVGSTGIEMTHFYEGHYPGLQKEARNVPHAYFYEMGRNYYVFGSRHSCFVTGFAVFMRYVCVETLDLVDRDEATKETILAAIDGYEKSDLGFVEAFTVQGGLAEKVNRLKDAQGRAIGPTDQPVMYASLMMRLRRDYGGNDWVARFFRQLETVPGERARSEAAARRQCVSWLVCASLAAGEDLSPLFCDRYRLPLSEQGRAVLAGVQWDKDGLTAGEVIARLPKEDQQGAK
ncbi:hypothetical protein [Roseibacillus ishigakijimensis]|uniref:Uncharacterized protein n=1 Tax=Roseibacillus ishigakijimensis TaxID=454146 RepID=A0A934RSG5_9BACT|nr:hypothetical protein [Roseibacillus ishigakijimensis]MBK1835092.1 hypothetical protein [Roseibacillus ishigakijimensis]